MTDTAVLERLDDVEYLLKGLPVPEYVGVPFVAAKLGVSPQWLNRHWWLQPNFGTYDNPAKRTWKLSTVRTWIDGATVAERQAEWNRLPSSVQKAKKEARNV